ncbi:MULTISPECIES: NUDIX hydrolase [Pseudomonas]|uniref:NUDIX hydrolase n=1 Tax=Pseudomonas TaxID=286 RepID=UPI000B357FE3|nr:MULTISPECIES: NUDIX domain-containing protein [Pseudomonas]PMY60355.1 Nudix family hydrolase [Pseudomonas sp. FW305-25]PMY62594.1 Nudix family hydrolase [Pseudomonas sp. FW126-L8]PNA73723.1 Nudix family hydrolase [Pseudomonas sp. FW305-76]WDH55685.1 NUDIX domain-containing protein [Pseudomonas chlororaphis]
MQRRRLASRILLISDSQRLLLFNIRYGSGALAGRCYWATPGGKLQDNESFEAAAIRELYEEAGVEIQSVGQCVAHREFPWQMPDGEQVLAVENYYVVRVREERCSRVRWSDQEREAVCDVKWWSESELAACPDEIFPQDLLNLFVQAQ